MLLSTIRRRLTLVALLALALTLALSFTTFPSAAARVLAKEKETLTAPFVKGQNGATTTRRYAGHIGLSVSGFGQAAGTKDSDAFYIFTDDAGNPVTPYHLADFGLCINHQSVDAYVALPAYRNDHTYRFTIAVHGPPQKLTFGVCDGYTIDNSGRFIITVHHGNE